MILEVPSEMGHWSRTCRTVMPLVAVLLLSHG